MNEQSNKALALNIIALVLLFLGVCWWMCRSGTPEHVSDQRDRAVEIGNKLGKAEAEQREIQQGAEAAAERARSIEGTISEAAGRAGSLGEQINGDGAIIEECQRILETVRRRGKAQAPSN